jgi:glucuronoarabinoxylan endo-1,4-beta-xylanase
LSVYDLLGREVSVLVNERKAAGVHFVRFDASALASGVYIYRLQARTLSPAAGGTGTFVQSRKLLLLR